ncbi:hypothetical protein CapIbe_019218 [Capra ibex]
MSGLSGCGQYLQVLSGRWAQSTQKEENLQIKPKGKLSCHLVPTWLFYRHEYAVLTKCEMAAEEVKYNSF